MILGRNAGLWTALAAALVNVAAVLGLFDLTIDQWAAVNAAAFAVVGLVANAADAGTVPTFAPTFHGPTTPLGASTDGPP